MTFVDFLPSCLWVKLENFGILIRILSGSIVRGFAGASCAKKDHIAMF